MTLSLKRRILAQARISQSQQSQNVISRPGETTLAQMRILLYSPGFHPPSFTLDHTTGNKIGGSTFNSNGRRHDVPRDEKRNKFGFVRFRKEDVGGSLEKAFQNVWIGNYKVMVNKPIFNKNRERLVDANVFLVNNKQNDVLLNIPVVNAKNTHKTSLAQWKEWEQSIIGETLVSAEKLELFKECLVGDLIQAQDVSVINYLLAKEDLFSLQAIPMGGNLVFFKGDNQEEMLEDFKLELSHKEEGAQICIVEEKYNSLIIGFGR
ncbi:hypothetical protein Lal_00004021 [Lupinus albus]|nr:hypothetical protein Lal_00004021 [Lupinus albus]